MEEVRAKLAEFAYLLRCANEGIEFDADRFTELGRWVNTEFPLMDVKEFTALASSTNGAGIQSDPRLGQEGT